MVPDPSASNILKASINLFFERNYFLFMVAATNSM